MTDNNRKENVTRSFCDADECDPALPPEMLRVNESQAWRDLFDGLSHDKIRVIIGLVRAMRSVRGAAGRGHPRSYDDVPSWLSLADGALFDAQQALTYLPPGKAIALHYAADTAWHIAHAISQMGES